jgi:hypothetical protein
VANDHASLPARPVPDRAAAISMRVVPLIVQKYELNFLEILKKLNEP